MKSLARDVQDEPLGTPQLMQAAASWHLRSGRQENSFFLPVLQAAAPGPAQHVCRRRDFHGQPHACCQPCPVQGKGVGLASKPLLMARVGLGALQGQKGDRHTPESALPAPQPWGDATVTAVKGIFSTCSPTSELSSPWG